MGPPTLFWVPPLSGTTNKLLFHPHHTPVKFPQEEQTLKRAQFLQQLLGARPTLGWLFTLSSLLWALKVDLSGPLPRPFILGFLRGQPGGHCEQRQERAQRSASAPPCCGTQAWAVAGFSGTPAPLGQLFS